jgi:iron transport multicopper oxidase
MMSSSRFLVLFSSLFSTAFAGLVNLNWSIGWVNANPDGRVLRAVIGINGQWPCPTINANVGDLVTIQVTNNLGNETTSLYFHGLYQTGSNDMDGPVKVTQCPIPPGDSFTYTFFVSPLVLPLVSTV